MTEHVTDDLWGMSDPIPGDINDNDIGTFDTNYIKYFWNLKEKMDCTKITKLVIPYIDRGIRNFIDFANTLKDTFPNLKSLQIEQNYCPRHDTVAEFLQFLKILQLNEIIFIDFQSEFTKELTKEQVLSVVPNGSTYFIRRSLGEILIIS